MLPALPTGMQSASSSAVERLGDLERGGLLPLDAELVDRVDERDRVLVGEFAYELQGAVEVALDRDHLGAVHQRLGELPHRDLAFGHDHHAADAGAGRVGGKRRRSVAGRCADHGLCAVAHRCGDRAGHAAVLEAPGRVGALDLQPDVRADPLG